MNIKKIHYTYSQAITQCDCSQDVIFQTLDVIGYHCTAQQARYNGECSCGLKWRLQNGKIWSESRNDAMLNAEVQP